MTAAQGFVSFLATTVVLLLAVLWTGFRARRRQHLPLVAFTLVALGITIYFAERLGESYDLETAGWITPLHLGLAKFTTLAYIGPLVTGWRTLRRPSTRRTHRFVALTVVALTVATLATGLAMILSAERIAALALTGPRPLV